MAKKAPAKKAKSKSAVKDAPKKVVKAVKVEKTQPPKKVSLTVYEELANAADVHRTDDETFPAYAERLCETVAKMSDDAYAKLSKGADSWFNAAVDAINSDSEVPPLPGFDPKPKKVKEPKAPKEPKARKLRGMDPNSVGYRMRVEVIKDPMISFEDACNRAGLKDAQKGGNAWIVYWNSRQTLRVMEEISK